MQDYIINVFVPTPGVRNTNKKSLKLHAKHAGPEDEFAHFVLEGTTFSGHPTLTTLGNTLRSILYCKYAFYKAQLEPRLMVAGDDCVMYTKSEDAHLLTQSFSHYVSSSRRDIPKHGLGQVVKKFSIKPWW